VTLARLERAGAVGSRAGAVGGVPGSGLRVERRVAANRVGIVRSRDRARRPSRQVGRDQVGRIVDGAAADEAIHHRELLLGSVDLLQVRNTGLRSAVRASRDKVGHGNRKKDANDQNDDHDFDERKALRSVGSVHIAKKTPIALRDKPRTEVLPCSGNLLLGIIIRFRNIVFERIENSTGRGTDVKMDTLRRNDRFRNGR